MWAGLDAVGLGATVRALPGGLRSPVGPHSFSGGQRQLLCVARAALREGRCLAAAAAAAAAGSDATSIASAMLGRGNASFAVCTADDAPVVLVDEATANVDRESEDAVNAALRRAFAGRTMLVVAHRLKGVMDCDLVVVLAPGGAVAEIGPPLALAAADGAFAALLRSLPEADREAALAVAAQAAKGSA